MKLLLTDVDEFCKNLPAITDQLEIKNNKFTENGLFSQKIFGPVSTATCGCGNYWGRNNIGETCGTCNVDITYNNQRKKRFAKIVLPYKVVNPMMYHIISKVGKTTIKNILTDMLIVLNVYGYYLYKGKYIRIHMDEIDRKDYVIPKGAKVYAGRDGTYDLVMDLAKKNKKDDPSWQVIYDNMNIYYMNNVIVIPPDYRPASMNGDINKIDVYNTHLRTILRYCIVKSESVLLDVEKINRKHHKYLHQHIFELHEYVYDKLSKKKGMIRKNILGKRLDFSGRAVITPDPLLTFGECSIPYKMALELYKIDIAKLFLSCRKFNRMDKAFKYIEEQIKLDKLDDFSIVSEHLAGNYIELNRQPTLHRIGLLGFIMKLNRDHVIKLHPLVCESYNADFDGDQMAVYRPLSKEAIDECEQKLFIMSNLISPSTGNVILSLSQDVVLGLYLLTLPNKECSVVIEGGIKTYQGRVTFNKIIPDKYPFINKTIDKKTLKSILNDVVKTCDRNEIRIVIDKVKLLGFESTTSYGCTMSLKDMKLPQECFRVVNDIFNNTDMSIRDKILALQGDSVMDNVKRHFPYSDFIESGSRGSWDQANQIILCRGFIANSQGKIIEEPVRNNLVNGLTKKEFFNSCYGSRKGLLDTAINTGTSGYLTRMLVYASSNIELDINTEDCGTVDCLAIDIPSKNDETSTMLLKSLIGRWMVVSGSNNYTLITYMNYHKYYNKKIYLRSPIYCKNPSVCKKCYGDSSDIIHTKYIGVIAAQALGEISTQLVLRTFHISGTAQIDKNSTVEEDEMNQDIINDLTVAFKLFRCTDKSIGYKDLLMKLFTIYSKYGTMLMIHHETIISQMMRIGRGKWRLTKDRMNHKPELISINNVPERESHLLGLAFCKPKPYIVDWILHGDKDDHEGILERIMQNKILGEVK